MSDSSGQTITTTYRLSPEIIKLMDDGQTHYLRVEAKYGEEAIVYIDDVPYQTGMIYDSSSTKEKEVKE